ncbi:trypsin-like peptidase domain-containing protein [Roseovarius sp. SCSIO 43702]|nr:trypsin-like peptidase domain-containing protein [Roseovarius sp. SCSIO 43702]
MRNLAAAIMAVVAMAGMSAAQGSDEDLVWVQIEAQPSLAQVNEALRRRAAQLQDVNGFQLNANWYAVALGPYRPEDAEQVLRVLRAEGRIPRDSYIAESSDYARQIWPVGSTVLADLQGSAAAPFPAEPEPELDETGTETATLPDPEPDPEPADETPREARASERELTREDRADLQVALQWAGFYQGRIDAAFGPGTRRSMAAWQEVNGYEVTGILTTRQRAELLRQYNAVLEGLDLRLVSDPRTGIEIKLPLGVVAFSRLEPPFAHYEATGDIPAKVLLISQEGDQDTLFGLYDIMQTLRIVPVDGPRERKDRSFVLIGESATTVSHTVASLENGRIKGFTLVWPAGDEDRRTRLLAEMQESFRRIDGVLDPAAGSNAEQDIDLVSGLEIRRPIRALSGFFADSAGTVVTTARAVEGCGHITLEDDQRAEVLTRDEATGIAILKPQARLAPMGVARLQAEPPRLNSDIAVAGYSFGGVLGAPSITHGTLADLRGLAGEETMARLALAALEGDAGGPVLDTAGGVVGMLLPPPDTGRQLPDGVSLAADAEAISTALRGAGLTPVTTSERTTLTPDALAERARRMTVLVSCWE